MVDEDDFLAGQGFQLGDQPASVAFGVDAAAGIKLDVVASDTFGVSGRAMLDALVAGERDPHVLAGLARGVLRNKTDNLRLALAGRFTTHHGQMIGFHLTRLDQLDQVIGQVKEQIGDTGIALTTSMLRPGPPTSRNAAYTGHQYGPVDSIATRVTSSSTSQDPIASRSA